MMPHDNLRSGSVKSSEELLREKKRMIARKFMWGALSVIGIIILLVAFVLICTSEGRSLKKTETENTAINALKLKAGHPDSIRILDISMPDSVFENRMCPEYEIMELSEKFLEYSLNIMQTSPQDRYGENSIAYRCKMDRYADSSNALNTLNAMLEKPQGKHCGWRVKVRYSALDDSDTSYISEAWFIFDKDKKHVLNSFDISLL